MDETSRSSGPDQEIVEEDEIERLKFSVNVSIRYQQKRRAFYEAWHRVTVAVAMVTSSAAFATLASSSGTVPAIGMWLALLVAVLTAVDWVVGYSEKAKLHDQLYRQFTDLAADIVGTLHPTPQILAQWQSRNLLIEADEPSQLRVLTRICHNEEAQAQGDYDLIYPVTRWQYRMRHYISFEAGPVERLSSSSEEAHQP